MVEFVLKNNYLEFGNTIKPQIFGTASGTKFYEASGTKFHENTCHRHVMKPVGLNFMKIHAIGMYFHERS